MSFYMPVIYLCALLFGLFAVSLFLTEDAAAVFLHVQTHFAGLLLSLPEQRTEIPVIKLDAVPHCSRHACFNQQLVILVGGDKQRSAYGVETARLSLSGESLHSHLITFRAAAVEIAAHFFQKESKSIFIPQYQGELFQLGKCFQAVAPTAVFGERMYIGIIPKAGKIHSLFFELADTGYAAWPAAEMH